ncbi:DUF1616 domain-containing protein (plasmid) [Halorussus limi]|uniref:DUF1616 domain-containing protein n=1 Tax=Halorussus limi TaxID=2938695 RepID=A0A8U0I0Y5_9EURY|nr:DUF1616 domain-containing protein [Halorussus limi]UPV76848.1 DUF1616 domain-containing protein [Halorussus limi]
MESRPARGYLDLLVAFGLLAAAAAATALSLDGIARFVLLIPTVVFLPGYAVVALVYPTRGSPPEESTIGPTGTGLRTAFSRGDHGIGGVERVVLAVLWTVIVVPAVALAVHFSPFPIAARPIQVGVFGATAVLLVCAAVSRARQSPDDRFAPGVPSPSDLFGESSSGFRTGSPTLGTPSKASRPWSGILVAVSLLVLASSVGYALVAPPADEGFTELYVQSGNVTDETTALYPSTLTRGRSQPLDFAVVNREGSTVEYGYAVELQRVERSGAAGANASVADDGSAGTKGANDSVEVVAETEVDRGSFELAAGETRNLTAQITPQATGDDLRIVVLVYRGDPPQDPSLDTAYRSLRLPVEVAAGGDGANGSAARRTPRVPRGDG